MKRFGWTIAILALGAFAFWAVDSNRIATEQSKDAEKAKNQAAIDLVLSIDAELDQAKKAAISWPIVKGSKRLPDAHDDGSDLERTATWKFGSTAHDWTELRVSPSGAGKPATVTLLTTVGIEMFSLPWFPAKDTNLEADKLGEWETEFLEGETKTDGPDVVVRFRLKKNAG